MKYLFYTYKQGGYDGHRHLTALRVIIHKINNR